MKLIMTGLDHKHADLVIREKFAVTKEKAKHILSGAKSESVGGYVLISTCNRTEFYASVPADSGFQPSKTLCALLGMDIAEYERYLTERTDGEAIDHLCRVASGLDSQIMGDDQIITQVREALELSRGQNCADSHIETMFRLAIRAAKIIKTHIISNSSGKNSIPAKAVEKLKTICSLEDRNAVVIGSGKTGRLVSELLIKENMNVTIAIRTHHKKNDLQIPDHANTVAYDERYKAIEKSDIMISATTSPHLTITGSEMTLLKQLPKIIIDLAVPRDVEPSVINLPGVTLLTIEDISGEALLLPVESVMIIEKTITEYIKKYQKWLAFKEKNLNTAKVNA